MAEMTKTRPKFLSLAEIRLPVPGFVSILHRVSGAGLFLALPFLLCLLQLSLGTAENFESFKAIVGNPLAKLALFGLCWAYLHHFCAGVRHLWMEMTHSVSKEQGKSSAAVSFGVSLLLTVALAARLFGLF